MYDGRSRYWVTNSSTTCHTVRSLGAASLALRVAVASGGAFVMALGTSRRRGRRCYRVIAFTITLSVTLALALGTGTGCTRSFSFSFGALGALGTLRSFAFSSLALAFALGAGATAIYTTVVVALLVASGAALRALGAVRTDGFTNTRACWSRG